MNTNALNDLALPARENLASKRNTPVETLVRLAGDDHWTVRRAVAANENTPAETLRLLADDSEIWVRWAVATNLSAPAPSVVTSDQVKYARGWLEDMADMNHGGDALAAWVLLAALDKAWPDLA